MLTADQQRPTTIDANTTRAIPAGGTRPTHKFVVGLLIPEFPDQTHCSWWRVGNAMRGFDVDMHMLSTRRPVNQDVCHSFLAAESQKTFYCWPPAWGSALLTWLRHPSVLWKGLRYLAGLRDSTLREKIKLAPLLFAATGLRALAIARNIDAIFVHSCANAAHLLAMCREMGGPRYALRLGGDLDVYGKDHDSKMRRVLFVASSSPTYFPDLAKRGGLSEDRMMWTWVGVDVEQYTPGDRSWERQKADEIQLVTVARLNRTKGHEDVLNAIAMLKERSIKVRYNILGDGPYESELRAIVDELNINDLVHFAGACGAEDVVQYLRRSDVAILASYGKGESSPAVVSEAMACGVPVICTRIGATPQMIDDGVNGFLVPQRDPLAIAASLQELAVNEPLRMLMAHAAYEHSSVFDCREVAKSLLVRLGYDPTTAQNEYTTRCVENV